MTLRILVVDDEPEILTIVRKILVKAGHEVVTAVSAQAAIELINAGEFGLAIIDLQLGPSKVLTGFHVAEHTRLGTERILLTGNDPNEYRPVVQDPMRLFRVVLGKPFTARQLLGAVEAVEKARESTKPGRKPIT